jgi:uncharacterized protein YuzE
MESLTTPIAVCGVHFTRYDYDEAADLLHLDKAVPGKVGDADTCEGHTVFVGPDGRVIGLSIYDPRRTLERAGWIDVTLRAGGPTTRLERQAIEPLLVETLRYA